MIAVRPAVQADRKAVARLLARAFIDDPAMAYLFPDAPTRAARLDRFFAMMVEVDADVGNWSLALDGGVPVAAALWRPPGAWATPLSAVLSSLPQLAATFRFGLLRALALQGTLEKHHPHAPHWYLQFVGCEPAAQGKGYGGAVIRARLALCDAQGLPAALETATPGNLGLYQALGFVITDSYQIRNGPDFWTMWREPR